MNAKNIKMKLILQPNETIIMAGNSKMRHSALEVQGKLIVTNQRIYFRTLKEGCRGWDREITPSEIRDLIYFNTFWLIPNGMKIITRNGDENQFIVSNRNAWAKLITRMY
jgi:hypothetical protein